MDLIRNHLIVLLVFFAIDIFWLGFVAKKLYRKHLGFIMADKFNWPAAIIFYTIFIGGLMYFAIIPAIDQNSVMAAFTVGGIYGFFTYITYDMTNLATLKDWPLTISIIDIIWGTLLNSLTAGLSVYLILTLFT